MFSFEAYIFRNFFSFLLTIRVGMEEGFGCSLCILAKRYCPYLSVIYLEF